MNVVFPSLTRDGSEGEGMQRRIGRYEVIRRLGKGGMGAVYKALVPVIDKVVAIKLLDPAELMEDLLGDEQLREIFTFEARTMATFHQPFLVTAHDFDHDENGRPFFVMEYICNNLGDMIGETYRLEADSRIIQPTKVLDYGRQIVVALAFLHHNRIVHRDIKPQNILVTDEDAIKICDFGMALVDGVAFSGPANMQIGSPYYTPPEQRRNPSEVDGRADLYSLAVLLFRMLTGCLPGMQTFSLSLVNPRYDHSWDEFFVRGLQWNPDDRFQSADEMLAALDNLAVRPAGVDGACRLPDPGEAVIRLRSEPANVGGKKARALFETGPLFRPLTPVCNRLETRTDTLLDRATGLVWQRSPSVYPLGWIAAHEYVDQLNTIEPDIGTRWRLPTVNELLSILPDADGGTATLIEDAPWPGKWLWSCDRHGRHESWYVNMDLRFVGVQDISCLNHVRAVRTAAL
jgi:serine/threonine-protein kinase